LARDINGDLAHRRAGRIGVWRQGQPHPPFDSGPLTGVNGAGTHASMIARHTLAALYYARSF
ncbi:MAG: hypothetical protein K0R83_2991, partial [Caulobacter sp.]|nr:hypothetical protein [Caulobacter sp.]